MGCCGNQAAPGTATLGAIPAWGVTPADWSALYGTSPAPSSAGAALPWWVWLVLAAVAGYVLRGSEARA